MAAKSAKNKTKPTPGQPKLQHGGARPNAGRKAKKDVHAGAIKRAEKQIADRLAENVDRLQYLAEGDFEEFSETIVEELAGNIYIEDTEIHRDDYGKPYSLKVKKQAFPDKEPDELVVTKRTITKTISAPNLAALMYLVNRIMGTPTNKHDFGKLSDEELLREAARLFGGEDEGADE